MEPEKQDQDVTRQSGKLSNDVHSPDFESKMDPYFTLKEKEKDHWTRRASIKLYGKWT